MNDDQLLKIRNALRPLFEELPEIPIGIWHRFSVDIVLLKDGLRAANIRFAEVPRVETPTNSGASKS